MTTEERLLHWRNEHYHLTAADYTPGEQDLIEYDAWLSQQDPRSVEEIDADYEETMEALYGPEAAKA